MSTVSLESVTIKYGNVVALDNFSLRVEDGKFVALLGPSGCGKTTCLRAVAGFAKPNEGNVYINGERVNDVPPHKRTTGIVFQNYALFPHKTVFGNVAFGLRMKKMEKGEIRERVSDVLRLLHLAGFEDRYPIQLSGGQQQRVALARALVTMPSVLLLDEPLGALDKKLREEMQIELRMLQKSLKITTIFVTHDQEEALTMADSIVIMQEGKTKQIGSPEDIYNRPQDKFVADFIGISNFLGLVVKNREEGNIVCSLGNYSIRLPRTKSLEEAMEVEIAIRPEKISIARERVNNLEYGNVEGTIVNIVYKGSFILFYVRVSEKNTVVVQEIYNYVDSKPWELGSKVFLNWRMEDTLILNKG